MKTTRRRLSVGRAGLMAAAIASVVAGCGQKGPLLLPSEEMEPAATQAAGEADDGEERDED